MVLVVSYDLHNPTRDYAAVIAAIKHKAGSWAHSLESDWFVDTLAQPNAWIDYLTGIGDANDEFFAAQLHQNCAWTGTMNADVAAWLKSPQRRW